MPTAKLSGVEIYYERKGEGAPLLFISGTAGDLRNTPNVFDGPFPKHFDTLAYDQRGLGRSQKLDHAYAMADFADDAAGLLDHLGWDSVAVCGVSFGGMVAQEFTLRHPARVKRLLLACTSPGGEGGASYPLHEIQHMTRDERARHMIPISDRRHDAAWQRANPEAYAQMVAFAAADPYADEPGHAMGLRRQLEARAKHDTWSRLSNIKCPVFICAGKYDGIALPETQDKMASRILHAKLRMFEGGHLFMLQDREAFPAMIAFLKEG